MALRLSRSIGVERRIEVGYGVAFRMRPFSFADYKELEAAALRLARETLPAGLALEVEAVDDEDLSPEVEDATRGRFQDQLLRLVLARFGAGWDGVELEDGAPAPFDREARDAFFAQFPGVVQVLQQSLLSPYQVVASEGKG